MNLIYLAGQTKPGRSERSNSRSEVISQGTDNKIEFFFASDASAIIEHTNKVIYLEDDDVAAVVNGGQ